MCFFFKVFFTSRFLILFHQYASHVFQFNWILIQLLNWIGFTSIQLKSNQIQWNFNSFDSIWIQVECNISIQMEHHSVKSIHILHPFTSRSYWYYLTMWSVSVLNNTIFMLHWIMGSMISIMFLISCFQVDIYLFFVR